MFDVVHILSLLSEAVEEVQALIVECAHEVRLGERAPSYTSKDALEIAALSPSIVMHGGAKGADACADAWCRLPPGTIPLLVFRADWHTHGKAAGPLRNARMLRDGKPHRGLAFGALWRRDTGPFPPLFSAVTGAKESWRTTGTGDMVRRMLDAGLPVRWVASVDAPAVDLGAMPMPGAM